MSVGVRRRRSVAVGDAVGVIGVRRRAVRLPGGVCAVGVRMGQVRRGSSVGWPSGMRRLREGVRNLVLRLMMHAPESWVERVGRSREGKSRRRSRCWREELLVDGLEAGKDQGSWWKKRRVKVSDEGRFETT